MKMEEEEEEEEGEGRGGGEEEERNERGILREGIEDFTAIDAEVCCGKRPVEGSIPSGCPFQDSSKNSTSNSTRMPLERHSNGTGIAPVFIRILVGYCTGIALELHWNCTGTELVSL